MPAYRGKDVVVEFDLDSGGSPADISGDARSVSFSESAEVLDASTYGDNGKVKIVGTVDANGSMNGLDTTGDWSTAWDNIVPGNEGELTIYPEGKASGNRVVTMNVIITERSMELPYDNLATFSMSFEINGDATYDTQV